MEYLSLFSGIGGFERGIQQAYEANIYNRNGDTKIKESTSPIKGVEECKQGVGELGNNANSNDRPSPICIGYSEIDKYAIQIYSKHFPNHKNYGDITNINVQELPDFELLVGGFPCQSFSIAGKRRGFEDTRGTLFFDIARILESKKPQLFLLENVKGLLSHNNGQTFKTIISTLDELGYDLQWQVLNSKNFGVPQNRERVFIIGHLRGTSRPEVFPIGESNREAGRILQLNKPRHSNDRIYSKGGLSPTLNTMQGGNRQPFIKQLNNPKHSQQRIYDPSGISPTIAAGNLGGGKSPSKFLQEAKIRRLTPTECERLQGFQDNWTEGISDTQRYKCCGNAVTVNVIQAIMEKLLKP